MAVAGDIIALPFNSIPYTLDNNTCVWYVRRTNWSGGTPCSVTSCSGSNGPSGQSTAASAGEGSDGFHVGSGGLHSSTSHNFQSRKLCY